MSAIPASLRGSLATRRNAVIAAVLALGTALSVAILSNADLTQAVGDRVSQGVNGIKTVAAMLDDRSPGHRAQGALASLKHKRQSVLHERALPNFPGLVPPGPLATLLGTPAPPVIMPPLLGPPPLYNVVAGGPPLVIPPNGGTPGGPPIFSEIPLPGGGGGGLIVPPPVVTSTPVTPVVPVTPAVPEPTTWTMMILGFAMMARALRRDRRAGSQPAEG